MEGGYYWVDTCIRSATGSVAGILTFALDFSLGLDLDLGFHNRFISVASSAVIE